MLYRDSWAEVLIGGDFRLSEWPDRGVAVVQFPGGISATSVFTMEQTRIFTASTILLRCSHDNLNRKKSGPST
jgi:hypothetical protein